MGKTYSAPKNKDYEKYSPEEAMRQTEQFFVKLEQTYSELDPLREKLLGHINSLLQSESIDEHLEEIAELDSYERLKACYSDINSYGLLNDIAAKEMHMNIPTVLKNGRSVDELCSFLDEIIFLLRRIEFFSDTESLNIIKDAIVSGTVSWLCITELIYCKRIFDNKGVSEKLCDVLKKCGHIKEADFISFYIENVINEH